MNFNNQYRPGGFGVLPFVTKNIIVINVLLFFLTGILRNRGIDLTAILGLHDFQSQNFRPHQFVTYIFMHADFRHIFFNMFGLFLFGQVLETYWGAKRFLIFYILTGLGAALVQFLIMHVQVSDALAAIDQINRSTDLTAAERMILFEERDQVLRNSVVVGASGSLFGLLGAFGLLFPNRDIYLYFLFPIKAKWLVTFYALSELFAGIRNNPLDNVAHFAHIGGLLVGLLIVFIWRRDRQHFY